MFRDEFSLVVNADLLCPFIRSPALGFSLRLCAGNLTPSRKGYFFIKSNTAAVIALTPFRSVGSGCGWNKLECREGNGLPDFRLASTREGSIAPSQKYA